VRASRATARWANAAGPATGRCVRCRRRHRWARHACAVASIGTARSCCKGRPAAPT